MKITQVEKLEDCFDGNHVYLFHFDGPWTQPAILQLAVLGKLDYFADFPRPFYRLRGAGGLQMKGVEGLQHCRVVVSPRQQESFRRTLEQLTTHLGPQPLSPRFVDSTMLRGSGSFRV